VPATGSEGRSGIAFRSPGAKSTARSPSLTEGDAQIVERQKAPRPLGHFPRRLGGIGSDGQQLGNLQQGLGRALSSRRRLPKQGPLHQQRHLGSDQRADLGQQLGIVLVIEIGPDASGQEPDGRAARPDGPRRHHRPQLGAARLGDGEIPARPPPLPRGVCHHYPSLTIRQRHQVERLALEQQRRIGPRRAARVLAQTVVPTSGGVAQQQLEAIVGNQGFESVAQRLCQPLRRRRAGGDLRHEVEQRRHPLELIDLRSVRRVPLPREPAERRGQTPSHELQQSDGRVVVSMLAQVGQQQEAHIAPSEAHGHAHDRGVSGIVDDFLDQPELGWL
jgi:hypothetical protein